MMSPLPLSRAPSYAAPSLVISWIGWSTYLLNSLSAPTRSYSKFCSSTVVPAGSVSDLKWTLVGSIWAATSVMVTGCTPWASVRVRASFTNAMPWL